MQNKTFSVVVRPDDEKRRSLVRSIAAQNATAAAGSVLLSLGGGLVDRIEVVQPGRKGKVIFLSCVYGMAQGFLYVDRFTSAC